MEKTRVKLKILVNEKAEMGVGTLIVFIAMIIVAAVAATVLISTAVEIQQQAEKTGQSSLEDVSTGFKLINIVGDRNNADSFGDTIINQLKVKVSLLAGSPNINVSDIIIEINDDTTDVTLTWVDSGAVWGAAADADSFESRPLRDMAPLNVSASTGLMTAGDVAVFYIDCNETGLSIGTQESFAIKIIPKHGIPTQAEITTPAVYETRFITLR